MTLPRTASGARWLRSWMMRDRLHGSPPAFEQHADRNRRTSVHSEVTAGDQPVSGEVDLDLHAALEWPRSTTFALCGAGDPPLRDGIRKLLRTSGSRYRYGFRFRVEKCRTRGHQSRKGQHDCVDISE